MLMMLSYHGNKQPGSGDDVLSSGKSRATLRKQPSQDALNAGILRQGDAKSSVRDTDKFNSVNRKYLQKGSDVVQSQDKKYPDAPTDSHEIYGKNPGRQQKEHAQKPAKMGHAFIKKMARGTGSQSNVNDSVRRQGHKKSANLRAHILGIERKKSKKDLPIDSSNDMSRKHPHLQPGEKSEKQESGTKRNREVLNDVRQDVIHMSKNVFSNEIKFDKDLHAPAKEGKISKGRAHGTLNLDLFPKEIPKGNNPNNKDQDMRYAKPNQIDTSLKKGNELGLLERRKQQEMQIAKIRKQNKIDALLKVLNKHPTTENITGLGKATRLPVETLPESKVNVARHNNVRGQLVSQNNTDTQNDKGKPNSHKQPVWHKDHYHRDQDQENAVVMQDKGTKNGAPKLVIRQSPEYIVRSTGQSAVMNKKLDDGKAERSGLVFLAPNISNLFALAHQHSLKKFKPKHVSFSYRKKDYWPDRMAEWLESEEKFCNGQFLAYNNEFAFVTDVIMDRNFCHGRKGGELITDVINQPEEEEYYTYFPGFFQLHCSIQVQYFFNNNNHLNQWLYSVSNTHDAQLYSEIHTEFTILVVRYEYANLYHTMTDWYNAFLLMEFFNKTQTETNILIVDGHPLGALDSVWSVLFNSSRRISGQSMRTKYSQIVWNTLGYNSLMMDHYAPNIPLIEEFRTFFLSSFRIAETRTLDCDRISILFIWRRDYVAHPRNPSGSISRKIQNEEELVITLRQNFPTFTVKGIQIDLFEMDQQLKFVTETDILIGMHGAGLTHTMFLPKHAGMIELLPTYWSAANEHFHAIARWRHIHYRQWTNTNPDNEAPNHFTKIPPEVLNSMVLDMVKVVCGLATDPPETFMR